MRRTLTRYWKVVLVLTVLAGGALPFFTPTANAIGCGECEDGTFNSDALTCGGAARNCTNCTVCAK